ncbi:hypothetical protein IH992_23920 [Candidatus Poribacteria bacterium]|nr:hypothetical protein [Candidatus Poribacteria bacterium]
MGAASSRDSRERDLPPTCMVDEPMHESRHRYGNGNCIPSSGDIPPVPQGG